MIIDNLYRYVYKEHNGYSIKKDNEHFGWYDNIYDALYDRDRLESVNWNFSEFVWLPETENKYKHMKLPPMGLKRLRQNVYRNGNRWEIRKVIDGRKIVYGKYDSLDEALRIRDLIYNAGWWD